MGPVVALLAARNLGEAVLADVAYVPTSVAAGTALLVWSRRSGSSWEDMGLDRRHIGRGLGVGGTVAPVVVAAMYAGAALPRTRRFFDDERVPVAASGWERLYQTTIRIPVGTVVFEEIAFRSVLLAHLRRRFSSTTAVVIDSALFGLWHIVPTLAATRANGVLGRGRAAVVLGSVMVTAVGGVVFCALRVRGRHVLAPALLHLAFNDGGYILASWVRKRPA